MTSRRVQKAAEAIREVVSMAILTELKDPRVSDVTVTYVEVSPDLRQAKVHVSVMGNDKKQELCLRGLKHAAGFLQSCVNSRIETRYTPRIVFVLDEGVKKSIEITRILRDVLPDPSHRENEIEDTGGEDDAQADSEHVSTMVQGSHHQGSGNRDGPANAGEGPKSESGNRESN